MSTEVTEQDQQPQEQPEKKPSEATTENGDTSSKPQEDGEEVKSKPIEKEEQAAATTEAEEQGGAEPTTCSPLEEKIIRQVEFYFGDRNLPKDKFLQQAVAEDDDGWVPLSTLLTFNRLKALSSDAELIANALKKTKNDIIEVNDGGTHVRRHPDNPVPDIFSIDERKKIKEKTVYVKGFNEDIKLDDLQTFFSQYGKTEYIQMRRTGPPEKKFKGSVFVEFAEKPVADGFLGLPTIKFNDTELIKESKDAYFLRKQQERKQAKQEQKAVETEGEVDKKAATPKEEEEAEPASAVKQPGCILFFKGCGDKTTREDIKEMMREFASVAFIDFGRGQTEGYVRFDEDQGAKKALEGMTADGAKPEICGKETELRVLEGEEEEQYWQKVLESGKNRKTRGPGKRGRRFGGSGRGGYWGRKRRQKCSASEDGGDGEGEGGTSPPVAKQPKAEDKED